MNDLIDDGIKRDVRQLLMVVEKLEKAIALDEDGDAMIAFALTVLAGNQFARQNGFPPLPDLTSEGYYMTWGSRSVSTWVKNLRGFVNPLIRMCDIEGDGE